MIKIIANYSKRLGLPGYSSHQFSVCVETEIRHLDDIEDASARLYQTLQSNVDRKIQQPGFIPRGGSRRVSRQSSQDMSLTDEWKCTLRQRALILKLIEENNLNWAEIDALARNHFFGRGIRQLYKPAASGLIDLLWTQIKSNPAIERLSDPPPAALIGGER